MRLLPILATVFLCVVAGCKPNLESQIPGTWKDPRGETRTFKDDKTFTAQALSVTEAGTWAIDNGDLVTTPKTINGKDVEQLKQAFQRLNNPSPTVQTLIHDIDLPNYYTISSDGKTLTRDKTRDKNSGPGETLTKQ